MEVKDIIKSRRIEMKMTMKMVADMVGVSEGTISRWESGDIANMRRDKIAALAKALRISPAVIMAWEEEPAKKPLTSEQAEFLYYYGLLNTIGKQKAQEYVSDLADQAKYREDTGSSTSRAG